ncbi:hypothetical protein [Streptomyces sp. NPDC055681]
MGRTRRRPTPGTPEHRQDDRSGRPVTGDGARRIQTFTTTPE